MWLNSKPRIFAPINCSGKFHCKPLPKNKPRGKKKKCVFKCDPGFRVQWTKSKWNRQHWLGSRWWSDINIDFQRVKNPRKPKTVKSNAKPEKDGSPSQNPSNVSRTKFPLINNIPINSIAKYKIFIVYSWWV